MEPGVDANERTSARWDRSLAIPLTMTARFAARLAALGPFADGAAIWASTRVRSATRAVSRSSRTDARAREAASPCRARTSRYARAKARAPDATTVRSDEENVISMRSVSVGLETDTWR